MTTLIAPEATTAKTYLYNAATGQIVHLEAPSAPGRAPGGCAGATLSADWAANPDETTWCGIDGWYRTMPAVDVAAFQEEFGHACDCEVSAALRG